MGIRHIIHRSNSLPRIWAAGVVLTVTLVVVPGVPPAMGDDMKLHRDAGVIGEKKTTHGQRVSRDQKTGITYVRHKSSFVTPVVVGDVAHFDVNMYNFNFKGLGWPYRLQAYWSGADGTPHPDVTADRVGFWVQLESPDKTTVIQTQEVDIPVTASLTTPLTPAQWEVLQHQTYVEDPFIGEERLLAAQQALTWLVKQGWREYRAITATPLQFTVEQIGDKTFVKTELEVATKGTQATKKCVLWALNLRSYRLKGTENIRGMETWICWVIGDVPDYQDSAGQAQMILETLAFNRLISEGLRQQQVAEFER